MIFQNIQNKVPGGKKTILLISSLLTVILFLLIYSYINTLRTAPKLIQQYPDESAQGVRATETLLFTFDSQVDTKSLDNISITPELAFSGALIDDGKTVSIAPTDSFDIETTYLVTINPVSSGWLKKDPDSLSLTFTTSPAPYVVSTSPAGLSGSTISAEQPIAFYFSSEINPESITYYIDPLVILDLSWSDDRESVVITGPLKDGLDYSLKLSTNTVGEYDVWTSLSTPYLASFSTSSAEEIIIIKDPDDPSIQEELGITPEGEELYYEALTEIIESDPESNVINSVPYEDDLMFIDYDASLNMFLVYLKDEQSSRAHAENWLDTKGIKDSSQLNIYWLVAP